MQPEIVELSDIQENGGYIDNFSQPENILVTDYYDDRKSNRTTILTSNINQSDFTLGNTVTITYTAIDSNGNQSTDSRDITVVDTISPNITLIGEPEMTVGISDLLYNYDIIPGITVSDDVTAPENILITTEYYKTDDNKQPEILLGSDIETINDVGTYLIRYKAQDLGYPVYNENIKTRCVNVIYDFPRFPDLGQAPTITLIGDSNITIGISNSYIHKIVILLILVFIVTDPDTDSSNVTSTTEYFRVDSDNVSLVELQDVSEINDIGNYKIKYSAQDNYKNKTTVERTVSIVYDFPRFPIENQQQTSNIKLNTNTESQVIDKNITIKKKSRSIKPIKKYKIETNNTQNNKSPVKFKTSNNKKRYSLKKHTRVTQDIELNDYYHDKIVMVDNNLIRTYDLFERFQYGNYKSFMIKNNTKKVIYITNMEFFMFVSDKNLRCSFYYIEKNPTNMKKNLKKDTWKEIRLHVRLQTFGKKCIEEGGSEINVPLTELEIQPKQTYYIIMELVVCSLIFYQSVIKHYDYKNKMDNDLQTIPS